MKGDASVREGRRDEGGQIHVSGFYEMPGMVSTWEWGGQFRVSRILGNIDATFTKDSGRVHAYLV